VAKTCQLCEREETEFNQVGNRPLPGCPDERIAVCEDCDNREMKLAGLPVAPRPPLAALQEGVEGVEALLARLAPAGKDRALLWDWIKCWVDTTVKPVTVHVNGAAAVTGTPEALIAQG
jgi:hypothetical protein